MLVCFTKHTVVVVSENGEYALTMRLQATSERRAEKLGDVSRRSVAPAVPRAWSAALGHINWIITLKVMQAFFWLLKVYFFDAMDVVYGINVLSYGVIPGSLGFLACRYLSLKIRLIPALLLTCAGIYGVLGTAHYFSRFMIGNIVYSLCCIIGLYFHGKETHLGFFQQHPYDCLLITGSTIFLSVVYHAPEL